MDRFRVELIAATPNSAAVASTPALHQLLRRVRGLPIGSAWPDETSAGEICVKRLLAGTEALRTHGTWPRRASKRGLVPPLGDGRGGGAARSPPVCGVSFAVAVDALHGASGSVGPPMAN